MTSTLCDMCDKDSRYAAVRAENDKLVMKLNAEHIVRQNVERENAKLRELVRDMLCELDAATQYDAGGGRGVVYEFADRMRELGVDA